MANFIGLCMLVTLSSPPGAQIEGTVSRIEPGKSLTLSNVICPSTGKYTQELTLKADDVQQLKEITTEKTLSDRSILQKSVTSMKSKTLTDPAILSFGKRPILNGRESIETHSPRGQNFKLDVINKGPHNNEDPIVSVENFTRNITLAEVSYEDTKNLEQRPLDGNSLSRNSKTDLKSKKRNQKRILRNFEGEEDTDKDSVNYLKSPASKSKGCKQTPPFEPNSSFQPFSNIKRIGRGRRDEEGWVTEDAMDVLELGDFDFEGGLAKFDKNAFFNQLQAEDSIAAKDRLVSFNRVRSDNFGKNLSNTNNVIDEPRPTKIFSKMKEENCIESPKNFDENQNTSYQVVDITRRNTRIETKIINNRQKLDLRPSSRKELANYYDNM